MPSWQSSHFKKSTFLGRCFSLAYMFACFKNPIFLSTNKKQVFNCPWCVYSHFHMNESKLYVDICGCFCSPADFVDEIFLYEKIALIIIIISYAQKLRVQFKHVLHVVIINALHRYKKAGQAWYCCYYYYFTLQSAVQLDRQTNKSTIIFSMSCKKVNENKNIMDEEMHKCISSCVSARCSTKISMHLLTFNKAHTLNLHFTTQKTYIQKLATNFTPLQ